MRRLFLLVFFISTIVCLGCETTSKYRRQKYIDTHPSMTIEQKNLMLKGRLWVGMSMEEVRASLGDPYLKQEEILKEKEVWSYMRQGVLTTHRNYKFDRVLRLEFVEGRLAHWRED
jgi:hypothetical protein